MRWLHQPDPAPPAPGRHRDETPRPRGGRRIAGIAATGALAVALTGGAASWWAGSPASPPSAQDAASHAPAEPSMERTIDIRATPPSPSAGTAAPSADTGAPSAAPAHGTVPAASEAPATTGPTAEPTASAPAPAEQRETEEALAVVRPGSPCTAEGAEAVSEQGRPMVCAGKGGGKVRWRTA